MLPDSTNPRVMADNIRRLQTEVENAVELPAVTGSDQGKVLTVNSSGKWAASDLPASIPKDYSTTEIDTGLKWVDGKPIYQRTFSGDIGTIESATEIDLGLQVDCLINSSGPVFYANNVTAFPVNTYRSANNVSTVHVSSTGSTLLYVGTSYSGGKYIVTLYYTKPTENRDGATETKKRKTTKGEN